MVNKTLVKPDSVGTPTEEETDEQVPYIYADYHDSHIPLTQFVKDTDAFVDEVISNPDAFNLMSKTRGGEVQSDLAHLHEKVDELEQYIDILIVASNIKNARGDCPHCGGELAEKSPLLKKRHIACSECGEVAAILE